MGFVRIGNTMKLILDVNAIRPELTGIGRYTWELAEHFKSRSDFQELRFATQTGWVKDLTSLQKARGLQNGLRSRLSQNIMLRRLYNIVAPRLQSNKFSKLSDHIYHGTSFMIPQFAGKTIATIHDFSVLRYPQFHPPARVFSLEKEIKNTLKRANFIITDSEFIKDELINLYGWPKEQTQAVPLGVSEKFHPAYFIDETELYLKPYGLSFGKYTLCVATIEPRKNLKNLLAAFARMPDALKEQYPLILAGQRGWLSDEIHLEIFRYAQKGWVKYLGFVADEVLPHLLAGARAFVYPSYYEGFGLPVLEAMASGVPVVASNTKVLLEVMRDTGLTAVPDDPDDLALAMEKSIDG